MQLTAAVLWSGQSRVEAQQVGHMRGCRVGHEHLLSYVKALHSASSSVKPLPVYLMPLLPPCLAALQVLADVAVGRIKILFVSPERLNNPHLLEALRPCMPLPLVVVDEAHCVAGAVGWGWGGGPGAALLDVPDPLQPITRQQ